ncbi:MAG: hypothetical protein ABH828_04000 [archaeon]
MLKEIILSGLIGIGSAKAQNKTIESSFNKVQGTVQTSGKHLVRMYNEAKINLSKYFSINPKIMNQTEPGYTLGWETVALNHEKSSVGPLYVLRMGGENIKKAKPVAHGVGARVTLDKYLPQGAYGFLDAVAWTNPQEDWVGKGEAALFLGKGNVSTFIIYRPGGNSFAELEFSTNKLKTKVGDLSLVGRIENTNLDLEKTRVVAGVQYTR